MKGLQRVHRFIAFIEGLRKVQELSEGGDSWRGYQGFIEPYSTCDLGLVLRISRKFERGLREGLREVHDS